MVRRKNKRSLLILCVSCFLSYSLFLLMIYASFQYLTEKKQQTAFPIMDDMQEYEEQLKKEEYNKIPKAKFKNCSYIVFDEDGAVMYASDRKIRERITQEDLSLIRDYDNSNTYSVYEYYDTSNEMYYLIQQSYYNKETGFTQQLDYCVLDENLNVVEGNLFADQGYVTEREFCFLLGFYQADETVNKWSYETEEGEIMTLVMIMPVLTEKAYNDLVSSTRVLWLSLVPIVLFCTGLFTVLFRLKLKRVLETLNQKICTCNEESNFDEAKKDVPLEFYETLDTLEQLVKRLHKANQDKMRISADLSHDLKTPLSVIIGCSKAFLEHIVPEDQKEKYMQIIYKRAQMATDLIQVLVEYTKLEHPEYRLHKENTDICEYIKTFLAEQYEEFEMAGFELDVTFPAKKVMLPIDRKLFRKCFDNLLGNALKYNPPGTTIYIKLKEQGNTILITVADNGVGIAPDMAERIFEPFVTENTARSSGRGTGLGLTIVRKIIEMHQGEIHLVVPPKALYATEFEITMKKSES